VNWRETRPLTEIIARRKEMDVDVEGKGRFYTARTRGFVGGINCKLPCERVVRVTME
jgi:hypothetical protein